jgi:hypothetical protein
MHSQRIDEDLDDLMRTLLTVGIALLTMLPMHSHGNATTEARDLEIQLRQLAFDSQTAANADLEMLNAELDASIGRASAAIPRSQS